MAGFFSIGSYQASLKERVTALMVAHPSGSFWSAALLALLLALGVALAWHLQAAGSGAATTNVLPKQSSTMIFDSERLGASVSQPGEVNKSSAQVQDAQHLDASVHSSGDNTTVQVNGQAVPVPSNGATHMVVDSGNGTTQVDVRIESSTNTTSSSVSSTSVNLQTSSESVVSSESGIE
ncbi:MAG: hypothetical protein WBP26_02715 [Candidatus Saccharimonadales bacterium]